MKSKLNIVYTREDKWIVARCLEVDVVSQGRTMKSAERNIRQAIKLYIDSFGEPEYSDQKTKPIIKALVIPIHDKAPSGVGQGVGKVSTKARIRNGSEKGKPRILAKKDA